MTARTAIVLEPADDRDKLILEACTLIMPLILEVEAASGTALALNCLLSACMNFAVNRGIEPNAFALKLKVAGEDYAGQFVRASELVRGARCRAGHA